MILIRFFKKIWADYLYYKFKNLYNRDPKLAADGMYYKVYGKHVNFENPQNLIEKIIWLSLYTDTTLWSICADKYKMRDFVKERNLEKFLPACYGCWTNPDEINFDKLPDSFVLKTNNGCGTVMVVSDKSKLDLIKTKKTLKKWLKRPFGFMGAQSHYLRISPCVLAEELLEQTEEYNQVSPSSMVDFKIWCFNGKPECILVVYNRKSSNIHLALYSLEWQPLTRFLKSNRVDKVNDNIIIPRPKHLNQMLEIAKILSKDFKEVRVDFYETQSSAIIGELTFTTGYGYFTDEYYDYLGSKIDLQNADKIHVS